MEQFTPYSAIAGGALIGLAATLLLALNGRIAGISGIVNGAMNANVGDTAWRLWFVVGVVTGGGLYLLLSAPAYELRVGFPLPLLLLAGFLVGFGTRLGNGCTSGHGVCGIARLSMRSLLATLTFLATGILTVFFVTSRLAGA